MTIPALFIAFLGHCWILSHIPDDLACLTKTEVEVEKCFILAQKIWSPYHWLERWWGKVNRLYPLMMPSNQWVTAKTCLFTKIWQELHPTRILRRRFHVMPQNSCFSNVAAARYLDLYCFCSALASFGPWALKSGPVTNLIILWSLKPSLPLRINAGKSELDWNRKSELFWGKIHYSVYVWPF